MIDDPDFDGDVESVRDHYRRIDSAIAAFATLGETYPTLGFGGNAGWYQTRDTDDLDAIGAGYPQKARCTTLADDYDTIIREQLNADDRGRELFNITSFKAKDAPGEWLQCTSPPDREWRDESHPPGYDAVRGIGFWFDLDLADKAGRAELSTDELETVETVQSRVIDAVADAHDVPSSAVYGLDSGGGAYIYGPPEVALPIAEHLDAPERGWFFDDFCDRINDGPLRDRVEEIIADEGAGELLDPDWIQNKNRQSKAPGAIHHDHDLVVTPLRERDPKTAKAITGVSYAPTKVSEFDDRDAEQLEGWADGLTRIEYADSAVGPLLRTLYPEHADDADGWEGIVDARVEELREARESRTERAQKIQKHADEWGDDEDGETSATGQYRGAEIVTDTDKVSAAISTIDVGDVVEEYAADEYDTSNRDHETTFDPSWRTSNSGESCAIPNGENVFVDNGCDGGGDALKAFALGEEIVSGDRAAAKSLSGAETSEAVAKMRAEGYDIPVYVPEVGDDRDQTPLWALRNAALALGVVDDEDGFKEHETDDGETYLGFDAQTYNELLDELDDEEVSHGRDRVEEPTDDSPDPIKAAIARHNDEYDSPDEVPDDALEPDPNPDPDTDDAPDWSFVRDFYEAAEDGDVSRGQARMVAGEQLKLETDWMYVLESERLWVYDDDSGTYNQHGESAAGRVLVENLGPHYSQTERREIIGRLKDQHQVNRREVNARHYDDPLVCVGNGVVNLETGDLLEHGPEYRFIRGLRWDYEPDTAEPGRILEFLDEVTERVADRDTLLDHLAHGLMPGHPYRAFVVCYGPGGNGKTQVAELFRGFVGEDNSAAVEIDELTDDDFATGDLPGKIINWGDDMAGDGGGTLKDLSLLKKATGGSEIRSNGKWEKTFDFKNEAAMFFSANEPPRIGEQKRSIQDRIYPIEMPYRFETDPDPDDPMQKQKVPNVSKNLLEDDAAMRGLLLLAVEHAEELIANRGQYSQPESPEERLQKYNKSADPIVKFAGKMLEEADEDYRVRKDDVYRTYSSYTDTLEERAASERGFKRQLPGAVPMQIEDARARALATADDEGDRVRCWKRVKWTETAQAHMPDWMISRYADHFDDVEYDDREAETEADTDDDTAALEALEPGFTDATVTIAEKLDPPEWLAGKGHLVDDDGNIVPYVCEGSDPLAIASEGDTVEMQNIKIESRKAGPTAVLSGVTAAERTGPAAATADDQAGLDTATDGGDTAETDTDADAPADTSDGSDADAEGLTNRHDRLRDAFTAAADGDGVAKKIPLQQELKEWYDVSDAQELIEEALRKGWIDEPASNMYHRVDLPE